MSSNERREKIFQMLTESDACISASRLAELFGVTRQIIVSDIAILRANGKKIMAGRNGYLLEKEKNEGLIESIICRHRADQVPDEFYAVVDNGGVVLNVMVEHPIYGQISADLNIASRYDAQKFMEATRSSGATQLCELTGGLHIHMIRVPDKEAYARILHTLDMHGILESTEKPD